jgi:hypothetical protein
MKGQKLTCLLAGYTLLHPAYPLLLGDLLLPLHFLLFHTRDHTTHELKRFGVRNEISSNALER